jgi:hypothetical protein
MKTLNGTGSPAHKEKFLKCFGIRSTNTAALKETVKKLTEQGVSRQTLVFWAVKAGYTQGYVSSLLSRILCSLGLRQRRPGAGRKPSSQALALLEYARRQYGRKFMNVLRAAWRAGRTQLIKNRSFSRQAVIVAPQIIAAKSNCPRNSSRSRKTAPLNFRSVGRQMSNRNSHSSRKNLRLRLKSSRIKHLL